MTTAQLRFKDGATVDYPLEEALQRCLFDKEVMKLSFDLPNGERVRILKNEDGTLLPTFWDEKRQNWYPRS